MKSIASINFRHQRALEILLFLSLWVVAYIPVIPDMFKSWISHSNNSHGLLVPFVSVYFLYRMKKKIDFELHGPYSGCFLFGLSLAIYLISLSGGIVFFTRLMMPLSLLFLAWIMLGTENLKKIYFPILFLLFMIPIPDSILNIISLPLQLLATDISAFIIKMVSIPVYQEGNLLYFTQTQVEVAEACSGIQSIMALTMLSVIMVHMADINKTKSVLLLLSAIPIAFIANIMRVTATGVLAHFYGDHVARSFLHDLSGIVVFIIGFGLLFALFKLISNPLHAIR